MIISQLLPQKRGIFSTSIKGDKSLKSDVIKAVLNQILSCLAQSMFCQREIFMLRVRGIHNEISRLFETLQIACKTLNVMLKMKLLSCKS